MTAKINLMFGIHSHQPVGNFEGVFRKSYETCYRPFLEVLARHPGVRVALHYSGPLLEWIEDNAADYIDTIAELAERGQVEMLSGGFYEPILPVIPREDAVAQLRMMNDYIERRFGQKPRGLWLTERVWEPHLPSIIAEAGLEYTMIDETHFVHAGLEPDEMFGYYVTEDSGYRTAVFPIDKNLRYKIPFAQPEDALDYLRSISSDGEPKDITYGDDGEKFGVWPDTYKWVYTDGYLEKMFAALEENSDWISMPTFSEYLDSHMPAGRVYLPTASYDEMMEWAQPADVTTTYHNIVERLKDDGVYQEYRPFVRGGFWRTFLAKYHEANRMHKKMMLVSRKVNSLGEGEVADEARRELWQGQCNCPYWHGLFGGLYLNYLRYANYSHLIRAEQMAERALHGDNSAIYVERSDYDCDGHDEVIVSTPDYNFYISPGYGGSVSEVDFKPKCFNITDVMSRRPEAYHAKLRQASSSEADDKVQSIHDMVRVKEEGLEEALLYDSYDRRCFLDRFLPSDTTVEDFAAGRSHDLGDFVGRRYELTREESTSQALILGLSREGRLQLDQRSVPVSLDKQFAISNDSGIEARYGIRSGEADCGPDLFAVEFNVTLLAGDAEDRYYEIPGVELQEKCMISMGAVESASLIRLVDEWMNIAIVIRCKPAATIWRFPIETVSQSEGGFEKTYQGSCVTVVWPFAPGSSGSAEYSVGLSVEQL
jgi:alpha-amylase